MKTKKYFIVVSNYSLENSKRQPWYTVKHLKDVVLKEYDVQVVSSFAEVDDAINISVIKFWSMKDLLFKPKLKGKLIYLMSFPIYNPINLLKRPIKLWENRKDLWKIFLVSFVPKAWLLKKLEVAEKVVFISDRSFEVIGKKLLNSVIYYPYFKGNWGVSKVNEQVELKGNINVGYFGPPFSSRGIDDVIKLINKVNSENSKVNFKLVIRTERKELEEKLELYKRKIFITRNVTVVAGLLSRDKLYNELQELDVIVLPFSFVFSELPIVVLEAIELNKLVLTTKEAGLHNIVEGLPCCELIDINSINSESDFMEIIKNKYDQNTQSNESLFEKIDQTNKKLKAELCQN